MKNRKLSISTTFNYNIPLAEQLSLISHAGFTHVSLGANENHSEYLNRKKRAEIKEILKTLSLEIDTLHFLQPLDDFRDKALLNNIIEATLDLSIPVIVCHGGPFDFSENEFDCRLANLLEICLQLEDIAKETGIVFALENVCPGTATRLVTDVLQQVDPQWFGFCYDSSHDQIDGPNPVDLLELFQDRLVAVHLSDRIREFVDHVIPGQGFIDFNTICKILRKSAYKRPLLFEVMMTHSGIEDAQTFLNKTYEQACNIYDRIHN
ncbi:MAG: TIM barrel protein [Planctomycetia bacterium]|nr:TIM barrel protein [Planctomycetia bacterium]